MKPIKYNPSPANALGSLIDDFFNSNLSNFRGGDFFASAPSINILENEKAYIIEMAAPGLKKEDISINLEDNYLSIFSEKEDKSEEKSDDKFLRREFSYTSFKRELGLPENVDQESISANHEDGVLRINLPKLEEDNTKLSKKIEIA